MLNYGRKAWERGIQVFLKLNLKLRLIFNPNSNIFYMIKYGILEVLKFALVMRKPLSKNPS